MKALLFKNILKITDIPKPVRKDGEALVKVILAGICNTDLEITKGYMNFSGVPGHEFVGIVEDCDSKGFLNKRVVGEINSGCGKCDLCMEGDPRHCKDRSVLGIFRKNGAFAEYLILPEENLLTIPDSISDIKAVFTEPAAAALQIFDDNSLPENSRIGIIGDGKLGLLISIIAKTMGFKPCLIGRNKKKLDLAEKWGIHTGNNIKNRYPETFKNVIECSGNPSGLELAMHITEPKGKIILKSTYRSDKCIDLSPIVINEISLIGSRCGRFEPVMDILGNLEIDLEDMITEIFEIEDGLAAFKKAEHKDSLKVLLKI
ncbi:alcohol dehydrogenase catalytic domain-containing protein [candidate division KSB1 bacterium]